MSHTFFRIEKKWFRSYFSKATINLLFYAKNKPTATKWLKDSEDYSVIDADLDKIKDSNYLSNNSCYSNFMSIGE